MKEHEKQHTREHNALTQLHRHATDNQHKELLNLLTSEFSITQHDAIAHLCGYVNGVSDVKAAMSGESIQKMKKRKQYG